MCVREREREREREKRWQKKRERNGGRERVCGTERETGRAIRRERQKE